MTMTVKTAPLALQAAPPAKAAAPVTADLMPAEDVAEVQLAADQNVTMTTSGRTSTATLSLTGPGTSKISNSNNNVTVINNFQGGRPKVEKAEKPEAPAQRENFFQLIGRAFGQLFHNLSFGFFGGLARGLRGEGAPTAEGAR